MLQSAAVGFSFRFEPLLDGESYTWDLAVDAVFVKEGGATIRAFH